MFDKSAKYYDEIYGFLDYQAAADAVARLVFDRARSASTLLDVACGTGKHLEHLSKHFAAQGLDILPELLELARSRCPGVPFHQGDMTDFDLGRQFDVVTCLFCSIGYMRTLERAEKAIAAMASHVRPGGLLIVEPWVTPEKCWTNRVTLDVVNKPELKITRMHTHEVEGRTSVFEIHNLVGTPGGVEHFIEREVLGLFTHDEYMGAFRKAGLEVELLDMALFPGHAYGVLVGRKPG